MHHIIVSLNTNIAPTPEFNLPDGHTSEFRNYGLTAAHEVAGRVKEANIIVLINSRITAETLNPEVTPNLRLISTMSKGVDQIDLEAARRRGIWVCNAPDGNIDAVSEHAISLYFAARRCTILTNNLMCQVPSEWKRTGTLSRPLRNPRGEMPLTCAEEICGIIGYGSLGKRISYLASQLGMRVLISDRKGVDPAFSAFHDETQTRTPFTEILRKSTVIFICVPLMPETTDLLSDAEFGQMNPNAVVVNIARGPIWNEDAAIRALRGGLISGLATDVLRVEPAEGPADSPFLDLINRDLNITMSPHISWFAQRTFTNVQRIVKSTVESWLAGRPINVIAGP